MRTMKLEDKENASPQLPPTPETSLPAKAAKPLAANPAASPAGQGAKNRFGYTPSPPGGATEARMQQAMPKPQPSKAAEAAPSAKTLIKELASGAAGGGNGGHAPTAKQLLVELQEQGADPPTADDHAAGGGGGFGAFTVSWTPVKAAKKPVLAAKKPAEKKAAPAKAAAREPAVPARRSLEKVGIPGKVKPVKDTAGSAGIPLHAGRAAPVVLRHGPRQWEGFEVAADPHAHRELRQAKRRQVCAAPGPASAPGRDGALQPRSGARAWKLYFKSHIWRR